MNKYKIPTLHKEDTSITTEYGQVISFPIHTHSYCEIILYEPFDGYVCINDQVITPNKATATLIVPGDFHEIVVNNKTASKFMKISFTTNIFEKFTLPNTSMILNSVSCDSLFFKAYKEIIENPCNEYFKKALIKVLVCIFSQNGTSIANNQHTNSNRYSAEAVRIINEEYDDDLTLASVAKRLSVTPQHLSNTFKLNIGINFSNYLTVIRLQHAEQLLIETNESITNICDMCGYRNFSHFIRSFKKTYGISPSIYRKSRIL